MRGERIRRRVSAWGLWLALLAFAFHAAIPSGFMLNAEDGNRIAVTICDPSGANHSAWLDLKTGQISDEADHGTAPADDGAKSCPFAIATAAALTPSAQTLDVSFSAVLAPIALPRVLRPATTPTGPPLPARGPPQQA